MLDPSYQLVYCIKYPLSIFKEIEYTSPMDRNNSHHNDAMPVLEYQEDKKPNMPSDEDSDGKKEVDMNSNIVPVLLKISGDTPDLVDGTIKDDDTNHDVRQEIAEELRKTESEKEKQDQVLSCSLAANVGASVIRGIDYPGDVIDVNDELQISVLSNNKILRLWNTLRHPIDSDIHLPTEVVDEENWMEHAIRTEKQQLIKNTVEADIVIPSANKETALENLSNEMRICGFRPYIELCIILALIVPLVGRGVGLMSAGGADEQSQSWTAFGGEIRPLQEGRVPPKLGNDIALSAEGDILAVGVSPGYDTSGYVSVYQYSERTLQWGPLGNKIVNQFEGGDGIGETLGLSSDGLTVAVGSRHSVGTDGLILEGRAQVFRYNSSIGDWMLKGQDLSGSTPCWSLGWSVALSGDGNRWVVSTLEHGGKGGIVQVFHYDDPQNMWLKTGSDIEGRYANSNFGVSVAISKDGRRVASYASRYDTTQHTTVSIFEEDDIGEWFQMGQDIALELDEYYTRGVALNTDGSRIVVASKRFATGTAYIKVLEWQEGRWTQLGEDIDDEDGCCFFYTYENSVAITDDGNRVVFGNSGHEPPGTIKPGIFRGIVRVYEWHDGSWTRVGAPIAGKQAPGEVWFGYATAISTNGNVIAGGAPMDAYVKAYTFD